MPNCQSRVEVKPQNWRHQKDNQEVFSLQEYDVVSLKSVIQVVFFHSFLSVFCELDPINTASFSLYICGSIVIIREHLINNLCNWNTHPRTGWLITIFYNFLENTNSEIPSGPTKHLFVPWFGLIPVYRCNIEQDMTLLLRLHRNFNTAVCVWVCDLCVCRG